MDRDKNGRWLSDDARHLLKIMQFAMQYYIFAQKHMTKKITTLADYLNTQSNELAKLRKVHST